MSDEPESIQPDDTPSHLAEFARQTQDLVDRALRTPAELWSSGSGAARLVPSIDSKFQLDRVVLSTETVPLRSISFSAGPESRRCSASVNWSSKTMR
jgi:hypothetical protein